MPHRGKDLGDKAQQISIPKSAFANLNEIDTCVRRAPACRHESANASGIGR
jgi:hypothetical protein